MLFMFTLLHNLRWRMAWNLAVINPPKSCREGSSNPRNDGHELYSQLAVYYEWSHRGGFTLPVRSLFSYVQKKKKAQLSLGVQLILNVYWESKLWETGILRPTRGLEDILGMQCLLQEQERPLWQMQSDIWWWRGHKLKTWANHLWHECPDSD